MTQAQLADTLAGCVNQQVNQEQPGMMPVAPGGQTGRCLPVKLLHFIHEIV